MLKPATGAESSQKQKKEKARKILGFFKKNWFKNLPNWVYGVALGGTALGIAGAVETQTGYGQSLIFNEAATGTAFSETRTIDENTAPAAVGPYDVRHGYADTLNIRRRMLDRGFVLDEGTTWQDRNLFGISLFPIYPEKPQAGLTIMDENDQVLHSALFPRNIYTEYEDIPPVLVQSLLYVENRDLLSNNVRRQNPAVEWERLFFAIQSDLAGTGGAGASTLATQIEKFRHSPGGETSGDKIEKFRQMLTASTRAYQYGYDTSQARQEIVLNYINAIPLSAVPGFGEVHGFSDGIRAWYGSDPAHVSMLLQLDETNMSDATMQEKAVALRQTLSIVMAVKMPTNFLLRNRDDLKARVDAYLPLLANEGIISERLRDAALATDVTYADPSVIRSLYRAPDTPQKSVTSMQIDMMRMMGVQSLYDINRYDITARTTLDVPVDRAVSQRLEDITDPEIAARYGLTGYRLLPASMTQDVTYTFTLYERLPNGQNVLRVQADNFDGQFNLNEDSRLELGSTSKLRTTVTYLEIISELHDRYSGMSAAQRSAVPVNPRDNLSTFVIEHLNAADTDKTLNGTLEAALNRTYSASPGERFYTGGGLHSFSNFDNRHNGGQYTVSYSLQQSLNLPFIRIMRDIVNYTVHNDMNINHDIYTNMDSPQRQEYLERFADREGTIFLWRAWQQQNGKSPSEIMDVLAEDTRKTAPQLAVLYRSVNPRGSLSQMTSFIQRHCVNCTPNTDFNELYQDYAPGQFNLHDRGYITGIHPLALWLGGHLAQNPDSTWAAARDASADERIEVYQWLLDSDRTQGQNNRIYTMIEREAFDHIHDRWQRMGFPFDRMTPSYAAALGASGDTPAALATLSGILQNDGLYQPSIKYTNILFAANTPYEMNFNAAAARPTRVVSAEVARLVRREMQNVVEHGTARRAFNSITLSDGTVLPVGAKTGTGDNRQHHSNGSSTVKNRTATFVYTIDDRFYGCVTAFVDGPNAANYRFTSGLPAQIFSSVIAPELTPLLDRSYGVTPPAPAAADTAANTNITALAPSQPNVRVTYRF